MVVPSSVTNIFNISDHIGAVIVGNMNDARFVVQWLRNQAAEFKFKFFYEPPVSVLA
jgi:20S proteasome subunit alpha 1